MALNYSVSLRPNPLDKDAAPKAYATSQINGELTLKQLSKRVSSQTTVSRADVVAVLTATVDNLLEALTEGKQVDFGELGKFRLQIASIGTEKLTDFFFRCLHRTLYKKWLSTTSVIQRRVHFLCELSEISIQFTHRIFVAAISI